MDSSPAANPDDTPSVRHAPQQQRYEVVVSGEVAGVMTYVRRDDLVVFEHTVVGDEFGGRGLGSLLARGVLDDMRAQGQRIVAECPFLASWLTRNPQYADLVAG